MSLLVVHDKGWIEYTIEKQSINESDSNYSARVKDKINNHILNFEVMLKNGSLTVCCEKMAYCSLAFHQNDIASLLLNKLCGFVGVVNGPIAIFFPPSAFEALKYSLQLLDLYGNHGLQLFSRAVKKSSPTQKK